MPARTLRHLRSHAVAYVALFLALGGTAYAATSFIEAPPNGSGGTDVANLSLKQGVISQRALPVPGLGELIVSCNGGQAVLNVDNTSGVKLDVFDNLAGIPNRMTLAPGAAPVLQAGIDEELLMGQVQFATLPPGAARAATIQVAIQESGGKCRLLALDIDVVKPQ